MHITRLDHGRSKHSDQWTISFLVQVSNTHFKKYGSWAVPVRWKNGKTSPNANFIFSVRRSGFGPYFWARPFKSVTAIMIAKSEHCKNLEVESWIKKIRYFFCRRQGTVLIKICFWNLADGLMAEVNVSLQMYTISHRRITLC